jgi:hypothetical protein
MDRPPAEHETQRREEREASESAKIAEEQAEEAMANDPRPGWNLPPEGEAG